MGTWSHEPFGNDSAADWAFALKGQQDFSAVEAALRQVVDNEGYLDADMAVEAIAAAEILAKANGRGTQSDAYTEPVEEWLESIEVPPPAELYVLARRALVRVLEPESELRELWEESDDFSQWEESVAALQSAAASSMEQGPCLSDSKE